MEGRGGCCIARYAGGGGDAAYDMSKMDRIMLRFRPIAPKPMASGGYKAAEGGASDNGCVKTGRGRRRSSVSKDDSNNRRTNNNGGRKCCRKRKSSSPEESGEKLSGTGRVHDKTVVTLPLLPETPDLTAASRNGQKLPVWLSFGGCSNSNESKVEEDFYGCLGVNVNGVDGHVRSWTRGQRAVVWSSVIVECVTDTWVGEAGLGRTDEEKRKWLEEDKCPGFISDGWNRVCWINRAFRKMARKTASFEGGEEDQDDVVVSVVTKEKLLVTSQAYTCRVRVQSTWKGRESSSRLTSSCSSSSVTLPCDVWRMSSGGFAWRLDVEAALCLGR